MQATKTDFIKVGTDNTPVGQHRALAFELTSQPRLPTYTSPLTQSSTILSLAYLAASLNSSLSTSCATLQHNARIAFCPDIGPEP